MIIGLQCWSFIFQERICFIIRAISISIIKHYQTPSIIISCSQEFSYICINKPASTFVWLLIQPHLTFHHPSSYPWCPIYQNSFYFVLLICRNKIRSMSIFGIFWYICILSIFFIVLYSFSYAPSSKTLNKKLKLFILTVKHLKYLIYRPSKKEFFYGFGSLQAQDKLFPMSFKRVLMEGVLCNFLEKKYGFWTRWWEK